MVITLLSAGSVAGRIDSVPPGVVGMVFLGIGALAIAFRNRFLTRFSRGWDGSANPTRWIARCRRVFVWTFGIVAMIGGVLIFFFVHLNVSSN